MSSTVVRRVIRTSRLVKGLGHEDVIEALEHATRMQSALRVLHTWASVPGSLDAQHVRDICAQSLGTPDNDQVEGHR